MFAFQRQISADDAPRQCRTLVNEAITGNNASRKYNMVIKFFKINVGPILRLQLN